MGPKWNIKKWEYLTFFFIFILVPLSSRADITGLSASSTVVSDQGIVPVSAKTDMVKLTISESDAADAPATFTGITVYISHPSYISNVYFYRNNKSQGDTNNFDSYDILIAWAPVTGSTVNLSFTQSIQNTTENYFLVIETSERIQNNNEFYVGISGVSVSHPDGVPSFTPAYTPWIRCVDWAGDVTPVADYVRNSKENEDYPFDPPNYPAYSYTQPDSSQKLAYVFSPEVVPAESDYYPVLGIELAGKGVLKAVKLNFISTDYFHNNYFYDNNGDGFFTPGIDEHYYDKDGDGVYEDGECLDTGSSPSPSLKEGDFYSLSHGIRGVRKVNPDNDCWADDPAGNPGVYDPGIDEVFIDVNRDGQYSLGDVCLYEGATPGIQTQMIGADDDGDGKIDEEKLDGKDDDGDGKIDEDVGYSPLLPLIGEELPDGVDNDGDGLIDEDLGDEEFASDDLEKNWTDNTQDGITVWRDDGDGVFDPSKDTLVSYGFSWSYNSPIWQVRVYLESVYDTDAVRLPLTDGANIDFWVCIKTDGDDGVGIPPQSEPGISFGDDFQVTLAPHGLEIDKLPEGIANGAGGGGKTHASQITKPIYGRLWINDIIVTNRYESIFHPYVAGDYNFFFGNPFLDPSSSPIPVIGINMSDGAPGSIDSALTFDAVRINFENMSSEGTSHFYPPTDLATLSDDITSGVAVYRDNPSAGIQGVFDPQDIFIPIKRVHLWNCGLDDVPTPNDPVVKNGGYYVWLEFLSGQEIPDDDTSSQNKGDDFFVVIRTSKYIDYRDAFRVFIRDGDIKIKNYPHANVRNSICSTGTIYSNVPVEVKDLTYEGEKIPANSNPIPIFSFNVRDQNNMGANWGTIRLYFSNVGEDTDFTMTDIAALDYGVNGEDDDGDGNTDEEDEEWLCGVTLWRDEPDSDHPGEFDPPWDPSVENPDRVVRISDKSWQGFAGFPYTLVLENINELLPTDDGPVIKDGGNGIVETEAQGDDIQLIPLLDAQGNPMTCPPHATIITAGPNGKIDTPKGGDDTVSENKDNLGYDYFICIRTSPTFNTGDDFTVTFSPMWNADHTLWQQPAIFSPNPNPFPWNWYYESETYKKCTTHVLTGGSVVVTTYADMVPQPYLWVDTESFYPVIGINVSDGGSEQKLLSVKVYLEGVNFQPGRDLAPLSTDALSGVSLWRDSNNNGLFDPGIDSLVNIQPPVWDSDGEGSFVILSSLSGEEIPDEDSNNGSDFFVVVRTSKQINFGTEFHAFIKKDGVTFTSGPSNANDSLSTNTLKANVRTLLTDETSTFGNQVYPNSGPYSIIGLNLTDNYHNLSFISLTVGFEDLGGFTTGDLLPLSTDPLTSGVALYRDNDGAGVEGIFDSEDIPVPLSPESPPVWGVEGPNTVTLTFDTPQDIPDTDEGENVGADFFLVIRTAGMTPGDQFQAYILPTWIRFSNMSSQKTITTSPILCSTQGNVPPSITITNPPSGGAVFNPEGETSFTITWEDSDPDDNAEITLYYDTDTDMSNGYTQIVTGINENDENYYIWDASSPFPITDLSSGTYYILAKIWDHINSPVYTYSGPLYVNHAPSFNTLNVPEGDQYGEVLISWDVEDVDDNAMIYIYYDTDNMGYDGTLINTVPLYEDATDYFIWDVSGVSPGTYYLYLVIDDGVNPPLYTPYSDPVSVKNYIPEISWISPQDRIIDADGSISIRMGTNALDNIVLGADLNEFASSDSLYILDNDSSGNYSEGDDLFLDEDGDGIYTQGVDKMLLQHGDTPGGGAPILMEGENSNLRYFDKNLDGLYEEGEDIIDVSEVELLDKNKFWGGNFADTSITINWEDSDPDNDATISLYYDNDDTGFNGTLITSGIQEDPDGPGDNSYTWDTTEIMGGVYYIYAEIDDGVNPPQYRYSPIPLVINHAPSITLLTPSAGGQRNLWETVPSGVNYWAVVAGVADYENINDLEFTDDDARDFKEVLLAYGVPEDHIMLLIDAQASKEGIRSAIQWMAENASPEDITIFFFSGHGTNGPDEEPIDEDDGYDEYICPYDMTYDLSTAIRDDELSSWIFALPNPIVILDTCYSGGMIRVLTEGLTSKFFNIPGVSSPQVSSPDGMAQDLLRVRSKDLYEIPGCVVLAATSADETGFEDFFLEHGVFTYFLLESGGWSPEGITTPGPADADSNGNLSVTEVFQYTQPRVIQYELENYGEPWVQHPQSWGTGEVMGGMNVADTSFTIMWEDEDNGDNAKITLYYDVDMNPANGETKIDEGDETDTPLLMEDDENDAYEWDLSNVPSGEYYIRAVIDDGVNPPVSSYSPGTLIVNRTPSLQLLSPEPGDTTTCDVPFLITWEDFDPDDDATINLYWDLDTDRSNNTEEEKGITWGVIAEGLSEDADGSGGSFSWDLSGMEKLRYYYVLGEIKDPYHDPIYSYSPGSLYLATRLPVINSVTPSTATINAGESINFLVDAIDYDGRIVKYEWDFNGDGIWDWISTSTGNVSYIFHIPGNYHAILRVTDDDGFTATYEVIVTVNEVAQTPQVTVYANPDEGEAPLSVFFTARLSSTNDIHEYLWDFEGDGVIDHKSRSYTSVYYTYEAPGVYHPSLIVIDEAGYYGKGSTVVEVTSPSGLQPPVASTENTYPVQGEAPLTVNFRADGSSDDGVIALYEWDFDGDGIYDWVSSSTGNTSYTYRLPGLYQAILKVTDEDGLADTGLVSIRVFAALNPPVAEATVTPLSGTPPLEVSFNDESGGDIVKWEWDFEGDGIWDWVSTEGGSTTYTYNLPGYYSPTLRVTDGNGLEDIKSWWIEVSGPSSLSILQPPPGKVVKGTGVSVVAEVNIPDVEWVRFDYSKDGTNWVEGGIGVAFSYPYSAIWNVTEIPGHVDPGVYFIRAVASDGTESPVIWVTVDNRSDEVSGPDIREGNNPEGEHEQRVKVKTDEILRTYLFEGTQCVFPLGEIEEQDTMIITIKGESGVGRDLSEDYPGVTDLQVYRDFSLEGAGSNLSLQHHFKVGIPYWISEIEGILPKSITPYYWDKDTGSWKKVEDFVNLYRKGIIIFKVPHLSLYTLGGEMAEYRGDINGDEIYNILDLQLLINRILYSEWPENDNLPIDSYMNWSGDLNNDGKYNVLDLQLLINRILGIE